MREKSEILHKTFFLFFYVIEYPMMRCCCFHYRIIETVQSGVKKIAAMAPVQKAAVAPAQLRKRMRCGVQKKNKNIY